ncbi:MAG TPA: hypothetical protein VFY93_11850 [Planctomycetota bacterium]|nr:hypothetical protein [Planctomycetota bacterium]
MVAYLDARDPEHEAVAGRLDSFKGRLISSSAVVTEAMHFVSAGLMGPRLLADFLAANVEIYDLTRPPELLEIVTIMEKYRDLPMDFADGTLVLLGDALGVPDVLTLDLRGFSVYRTRRGRAFRLVLP